jgi:subtilisin family serine protease
MCVGAIPAFTAIVIVLATMPAMAQSPWCYVNRHGHTVCLDEVSPSDLGNAALLSGIDRHMNDGSPVFLGTDSGHVVGLGRGLVLRLRTRSSSLPESILRAANLSAARSLGADNLVFVATASDPRGTMAASRVLASHPDVEWAVPDFLVPISLHAVPNDPYYSRQWHLHAGTGGIDVEGAWSVTSGSREVLVAVIDTGLDERHPEFQDRIAMGWDTLGQDTDPWPGDKAIYAHGTHCAGIIAAARNNGEGVAGICPECRIMGIRFMEGFGGTDQEPRYWTQISTGAEALRKAADAGAWVINNSWGVFPENKWSPERPLAVDMAPLLDAARYAATTGRNGLGAVVVFSSGNLRGEPIADDDMASLPEVIAVGGTGPDDVIMPYSQHGPNLSVTAPTNASDYKFNGAILPGIITTDLAGASGANKATGTNYTSAKLVEVDRKLPEDDPTGNYTLYFNGTSAAAPIVSGVAALVLSANPTLTGPEVRRILEGTADKVPGGQYDARGHDVRYGHGRVNARRAVAAATFGVGRGPGVPCVEDVNCASGDCLASGQGKDGLCGGEAPPDSGPVDHGVVLPDVSEEAGLDHAGPPEDVGKDAVISDPDSTVTVNDPGAGEFGPGTGDASAWGPDVIAVDSGPSHGGCSFERGAAMGVFAWLPAFVGFCFALVAMRLVSLARRTAGRASGYRFRPPHHVQ